MEAARVLKLRGHNPVIHEKTGELGGAFIAASAESYKGKLRDLLAWYRRQMEKLGIEVHLNDEVKDISVFGSAPVIIATGATPRYLRRVPGYEKMPLFYIWGHSFEFERENTWPLMEQLAEKLHGAQDIWYATNGQIADYLTALRSTRESADGKRLYNPSAQPIWFVADGKVRVAEPGKLCEI